MFDKMKRRMRYQVVRRMRVESRRGMMVMEGGVDKGLLMAFLTSFFKTAEEDGAGLR